MKIFLACLTIIIAFTGCTVCTVKKVPCDAFNEPAFFDIFPYQLNNRLLFKNTISADTISYIIANRDTSKAYEGSMGGYNNNSTACVATAGINSLNTVNEYLSIYYYVSKGYNNGPVNKSLSIYLGNSSFMTGEISSTGIAEINPAANVSTKIAKSENVLFENAVSYPIVFTLTNDTITDKTNRVYKLFLAKNNGIIGYEYFPSRQKWVIQ